MQRPLWARNVGLMMGVVLWISLAGWAQEDAPACAAKGNLKDDYLGKECTVGDLLFKFSKEYQGENKPDPARITVEPVQAGLRFKFPEIKLAQFEEASARFGAIVEGIKKSLGDAALEADLADGVFLAADLLAPGKEKGAPEPAFLELNGKKLKSMEGIFRMPRARIKVSYHLLVNESPIRVSPGFTSRFSMSTKEASEPESDSELFTAETAE